MLKERNRECDRTLTHITRLSWPLGHPVLMGFLPEISSRSTTPNAYTSIFSSTFPYIKYSGAKYLLKGDASLDAEFKINITASFNIIYQLYNSITIQTRKSLQRRCKLDVMSEMRPTLQTQNQTAGVQQEENYHSAIDVSIPYRLNCRKPSKILRLSCCYAKILKTISFLLKAQDVILFFIKKNYKISILCPLH